MATSTTMTGQPVRYSPYTAKYHLPIAAPGGSPCCVEAEGDLRKGREVSLPAVGTAAWVLPWVKAVGRQGQGGPEPKRLPTVVPAGPARARRPCIAVAIPRACFQ